MNEARGDGATGVPARRISDDDRQRVVTRLRDAAGEGALGLDELEDRIAAVYEAKTVFDLEPITADLPAPARPDPGFKVQHRRPLVMEDAEFRSHFTSYCMVMALLFVIWLAAGAHFPWPFIVAAAWGIGLGSHYQVAAAHQRKRLARARQLGISLEELELREKEERRAKRVARRAERHRQLPDGARQHLDQAARQVEQAAQQAARQAEQWARQVAGKHGHWPHVPPTPAPPPPPAADAPSRRYVVAMFVDVVGSTSLTEALGDEGWVRVRDRLRDTVKECVERESGWEVSTAGDGVLVRFEHPNRAACAAVEILRRLEHQRTEAGFAPSVRVGIHSGDVVDSGDDLIGSVVNLASRVTSAAEPDQIIVTEHVADHLDPSIHAEDRGIHSLRGVSRPRHLLSIRWR